MLRHVAALLLLSATSRAAYPKSTVIYTNPTAYLSEAKCCMGVFNQPHTYNGRYQVTAIYISSHVRNYDTADVGSAFQNISVTISKGSGAEYSHIASVRVEGEANPTELLRVPISYVTVPGQSYLLEMWYGGPLTYPVYPFTLDVSIGPLETTRGPFFLLGIDYEKAE